MKKLLFLGLICLTLVNLHAIAQPSAGGTPPSFTLKGIPDSYNSLVLAKPDLAAIQAEDLLRDKNGMFYRAGVSIPVQITPENAGSWYELPSGDRIWRLQITVPDARALGVYYDHFWLPPGGRLFVYSQDRKQVLGAYTEQNNGENGIFVNELVKGETLTLEYLEPSRTRGRAQISINEIAYVYRGGGFISNTKDFGDSESCEVNINCPEGTNWQDEKKGVARIFLKAGTSYGWCSGTLINNTSQDCTPYFLTADHCGNESSTADLNVWVFYFNYEAPACTNPSTQPTANTLTGCTLKASGGNGGDSGSDFFLVQLTTAPTFSPYFNGWDRTNTAAAGGVGIHHPAGDIKKISTFTGTAVSTSWGSAPNSHWQVTWTATTTNHGVTEGGSSGSPLFNNAGLVIGDLTGGGSYCTSPNSPDMYGKLYYSWDQNGTTNDKQLKPWLDPGNTGATTLAGYYCGSAPTLNADFTASATTIPVGGSVDFTDLSTGSPTTWSWTFSGGTPGTSTSQNPTGIVYNTAGIYTVTLTIGNGTSNDTETKTSYITVGDPPPAADFVANTTTIAVGGSVNFTDLSAGSPTSWSWSFTGGTPSSSTTQNPTGIVYNTAGTYTVSLTATNGNGSDTETKTNYIVVGGSIPGDNPCDTLNFPLNGTPVVYSVRYTNGIYGYISGNNGYSDKAKANYFLPAAPYVKLTGALVKFGKATKHASGDSKVVFAYWNNAGPGGTPGSAPLATDTVMLSTIISHVSGHQMTYIEFPTPIDITGAFYLGVYLPTVPGDTLAILTNKNGQTVPSIAWEQWQNGLWYNYADSLSWGYNVAHAIFPILCKADFSVEDYGSDPYVLIYPNPASSLIHIDLGPFDYARVEARLYNLVGEVVASLDPVSHHSALEMDISGLPSGIYTMQLRLDDQIVVRKVSVVR
jgi:PKD repeat protein